MSALAAASTSFSVAAADYDADGRDKPGKPGHAARRRWFNINRERVSRVRSHRRRPGSRVRLGTQDFSSRDHSRPPHVRHIPKNLDRASLAAYCGFGAPAGLLQVSGTT